MSEQATFGDFGGEGRVTTAGDTLLDMREAADEAAAGEWEYLAHTSETIGWHVPDENATLLLKKQSRGWIMQRAGTQRGGRRETLQEALELASAHMQDNPGGGRAYPLGGDQA